MLNKNELAHLGDLLATHADAVVNDMPLWVTEEAIVAIRAVLMIDEPFEVVHSDTDPECYLAFEDGTSIHIDYSYTPIIGQRS